MSEDEINERKLKILQAIVSDYVTTGEPVGSRTLAKKYDLGISPATIRNEMSDLEEMGYLEQPHTSSGRVPSSKGYRVYVDKLMTQKESTPGELRLIESQIINLASFEIEKIIRQASMMLAQMTNLVTIARTPSVRSSHIKTVQLVSLGAQHLIVVIVLDNSAVKNTVIKIDNMPDPSELLMISNLLTLKMSGLAVTDIDLSIVDSIRKDLKGYSELFSSVMEAAYTALTADSNGYIIEGKSNILDYPEFKDIVKARDVFNMLENPIDLLEKVNQDNDDEDSRDFRIVIGEEIDLPDTSDWSVISAKYKLNGEEVGTINLLGPKRLNYDKVTSILSSVVSEINKKLRVTDEEVDIDDGNG